MKTDAAQILIATRGSALALAQSQFVLAQCRDAFPEFRFELKIIKTTGDKLQAASLTQEGQDLPKGLFTKELELALLDRQADFAVHSLKDLPTELPTGLKLGAVGQRADVRDVLIYRGSNTPADSGPDRTYRTSSALRGFNAQLKLTELPLGAVVATSSTRRKAQVLLHHPGLKVTEIRGNVATRLHKVAERSELDATLLALAGLTRLNFRLAPDRELEGEGVPRGLLGLILDTETMLPCVGQGAVGIECREDDERMATVCAQLNDAPTLQCVTAERAFLAGMGGGCLSPVAAYAEVLAGQLRLRAISFANGPVRRAEGKRPVEQAVALGQQLAAELKGK